MNTRRARATPGSIGASSMKLLLAAGLSFLSSFSPLLVACGTLPAEEQQQLDAEHLQHLQALTTDMADKADLIFVGTVTSLERPARDPQQPGHVTLSVSNTLKGSDAHSQTLEWENVFILSCNPADSFANVGFRPDGVFIVYVKDGRVSRSAGADELRDASLLKLADEISLIAARHSN